MRVAVLIVASILVFGARGTSAQDDPAARSGADDPTPRETPDEVVVRGRRIGELRVAVDDARDRAYLIFNEINSNDDFDVKCREDTKYHSRTKVRTCRAQFETRISSEAAQEYIGALTMRCPANSSGFIDYQACMFSGRGAAAQVRAQGVEAQAPSLREQMTDEIQELARTNEQFGQAILDFYEATQEYEAARQRPPQGLKRRRRPPRGGRVPIRQPRRHHPV